MTGKADPRTNRQPSQVQKGSQCPIVQAKQNIVYTIEETKKAAQGPMTYWKASQADERKLTALTQTQFHQQQPRPLLAKIQQQLAKQQYICI